MNLNDQQIVWMSKEISLSFPRLIFMLLIPDHLSEFSGLHGFKFADPSYPEEDIGAAVDGVDLNGDGLGDIIFSAPNADYSYDGPNILERQPKGKTYVVFGQSNRLDSVISSSDLDGTNGFSLSGIDFGDRSGQSISGAGDINGDGIEDLVISTAGAERNGAEIGEAYVVFGSRKPRKTSVRLSSLNGANGFQLNAEQAFYKVSRAGDVNNDGIDDLLLGADGVSYVVFGKTDGFGRRFDLSSLNGTNGFKIESLKSSPYSLAHSIRDAGDVNGDGIHDIILGTSFADIDGKRNAGAAYIILGQAQEFDASLELANLDPSRVIQIQGSSAFAGLGADVSGIGDFNGDGFGDIIVANANYGRSEPVAGAYVIFGAKDFESASIQVATLDPNRGFKINRASNRTRYSSFFLGNSSGDINGDGFDDIIFTASRGSDSHFRYTNHTAYLIFGRSKPFSRDITLTDLSRENNNSSPGFSIDSYQEMAASFVADVNGDGLDDIAVGASSVFTTSTRSFIYCRVKSS